MELLITEKTKTREILPFLTTSNIKNLIKDVDVVELDVPITEMRIEEFEELISAPEQFMLRLATKNKRALVFLGKCKDLVNSLEGFSKFVSQYESKHSPEEKQAMNGINFPSFGNNMLTTLIEFYHLHSVEEASNMKVKEWMLVFEHQASNALFSRRYSEIVQKKSKMKK